MVFPANVAALKEQVGLDGDTQAILLAVRGDGRRRALADDRDVQAVFSEAAERGEALQVVVQCLPPQCSQAKSFIFPAAPVGANQSRLVQPPGFAKASGKASGPVRPSTAPSRPGPRRGCLKRAKEQAAEAPSAREMQADGEAAPALPGGCEADRLWSKDSTHLLEAMGLSTSYAAFRRRLRSSADFVEASLRTHREKVSLKHSFGTSPSRAGSRTEVHSRDLRKLQELLTELQTLEKTSDMCLLQEHAQACWKIPSAIKRLAQASSRGDAVALRPRRKFWESPWSSLGPFFEVAFRIYPAGDGDSAKGNAVLFFWAPNSPPLSFAFSVQVGEVEAASCETWYSEVTWARVEMDWAVLSDELVRADACESGELAMKMTLLHWHSPSELGGGEGTRPAQSYRDR